MSHFSPVELDWHGVTYRLDGDGAIMRALADMESHITIGELSRGQQTGNIPLAKLSAAYATLLRHAGCRVVSDADVYADMWRDGANADAVHTAIESLMSVMIPPSTITPEPDSGSEEEDDEGKSQTPAS